MKQQQIFQLPHHTHTHTHTHITNEDGPVHFDRQRFHRIHEKLNGLRSVTEIFHDVNICRLEQPARLSPSKESSKFVSTGLVNEETEFHTPVLAPTNGMIGI